MATCDFRVQCGRCVSEEERHACTILWSVFGICYFLAAMTILILLSPWARRRPPLFVRVLSAWAVACFLRTVGASILASQADKFVHPIVLELLWHSVWLFGCFALTYFVMVLMKSWLEIKGLNLQKRIPVVQYVTLINTCWTITFVVVAIVDGISYLCVSATYVVCKLSKRLEKAEKKHTKSKKPETKVCDTPEGTPSVYVEMNPPGSAIVPNSDGKGFAGKPCAGDSLKSRHKSTQSTSEPRPYPVLRASTSQKILSRQNSVPSTPYDCNSNSKSLGLSSVSDRKTGVYDERSSRVLTKGGKCSSTNPYDHDCSSTYRGSVAKLLRRFICASSVILFMYTLYLLSIGILYEVFPDKVTLNGEIVIAVMHQTGMLCMGVGMQVALESAGRSSSLQERTPHIVVDRISS
uniref:Uncharacterized protein n=1 Tax=Lotharella oceanica TaxID=641309 RepID=A0A7S2TST6_9EUKA|mmetsp:Transcript_28393/g.53162  ORF Transcript_28393/g.53162 Transcript_28393/m.53162 type:complete len:408 (+) Transcript_28393:128-1351(+)